MRGKILLMVLFFLFLPSQILAFTTKQIMSESFGLLPLTIGTYETVVFQFSPNNPVNALNLFHEMGEQQRFIINQVRGDKSQELDFKKKMLATSIAALTFIEVLSYNNKGNTQIMQACQKYMPEFVNLFGTSCVELGAVKRPKNNKLNVGQLQKEIYTPTAVRLIKYLGSK